METNIKKQIVPLNIVMTYPVHWNKYEIMRDFLQNFYDSLGYQRWNEHFQYNYQDNSLTMWVNDICFSYEWLLHIGASTKTENSFNNAGYFGEGFKIASLCAIRDYHWNVEMSSGDWKLSVIKENHTIDQKKAEMLAYEIQTVDFQSKSMLRLSPISGDEYQLFKNVILSFFYYGNPLLGEKIWEDSIGAVYYCNENAYRSPLPYTIDFGRKGTVFCSYQLLGSNPFGLSVCLHTYKKADRERKTLYNFDVIQVFETLSRYISPDASIKVLEKMRRYWNSFPKRHIDINSWDTVICNLIRNITESTAAIQKFRAKYPNLLCRRVVHSIKEKNRRSQARAWLSTQEKKYLIVQSAFERIGYPTLEEECECQGGFVVNDTPEEYENSGFIILENLTAEVYSSFFNIENNMPERKIIRNTNASYHGMATVYRKRETLYNSHGILIRYDIGAIYLKSIVFKYGQYYNALATYIHEFCHIFGGDSSDNFSKGLTVAMEILLENHEVVEKGKLKWNSLYSRKE